MMDMDEVAHGMRAMGRRPASGLRYRSEVCNRFVRDMERVGLEVEHYCGRFFWEGPAVRTDSRDDVARATQVRLQQDSMGLELIVYPVESGGSPIAEECDQ